MKNRITLLMITKNSEELLEKSLKSVRNLVQEIVIIDGNSTDQTREIARKFGARILSHDEEDLGKKRAYGLKAISNEWVLVLDADEIVSKELKLEIISKLKSQMSNPHLKAKNFRSFTGFFIPYQNHFLGRPINQGGENYEMLRLFRTNSVFIDPALVHEGFELKKGSSGILKNKIYHYSYRSLGQMFRKFTDYAVREAKQKAEKGERSSFRKIFLYPPHMFWARFIEDKGYKDGIFRLPLDIGFEYMELLTYTLLVFYGWKISKIKDQRSK